MPFFAKVKKDTHKTKRDGSKLGRERNNSTLSKRAAFEQRIHEKLSKEEVESSSDDEETIQHVKKWKGEEQEVNPDDLETAEQKKERLAQSFLQELKEQKSEATTDRLIEQELRNDVLQSQGRLFRRVAQHYSAQEEHLSVMHLQSKKYQRKEITCVAVNAKDGSIFSSSLDGSIVKYSGAGATLGVIKSAHQTNDLCIHHHKPIYALALSTDGRYLASGDGAGLIHVWSPASLSHLGTLQKHRGAVTGLVFQKDAHTLYSCGVDRLVMEWAMEGMAFVDNLGGHSSGVQAIDSLYRQSCISCGGEDETIIIYSVIEDKQFQFQARQTSVDGVKLLNENTFLTYGQDGSVCLWSTSRKRPLQTLRAAHGLQTGPSQEPLWITALAALVNTDLLATGSSDGFVRLWRITTGNIDKSNNRNCLLALDRLPVPNGVVNSLEFSPDGTNLVVGIGRSHKRGRWIVHKQAKSLVVVIKFKNVQPLKVAAIRSYMEVGGVSNSKDESSEEEERPEEEGGSEEEEGGSEEEEAGSEEVGSEEEAAGSDEEAAGSEEEEAGSDEE